MTVRNVLHINTADNDGGAARSGYRIHTGLKKIGLTSHIMVRSKGTRDPDVKVTAPFPFLYLADKAFGYLWRATSLQYLYFPSSYRLVRHPWYKQADVIQLYNIHGNFFSPGALPRLSQEKPIVWRLSDMWPFTGHCAYSYDCERWRTGCGECPILDEYPAVRRDTTAFLWKFKKRAYDRSDITLIAPSRWIEKLVKQSPLLGRFPVHYVPNGVDTALFRTVDKREAKKRFRLPEERVVVLIQDMGPGGERKGRDLLPRLVASLREKHQGRAVFLVFGNGSNTWSGSDVVPAGVLRGEEEMARLYSAADLFVFPTKAENLANVALESMACGVPVVSFNAGGMPDLIQNGSNGILAENGDLNGLVQAAGSLISDDSLRSQLSRAAERTITENFTQAKEAGRVRDIYEEAAARFSSKKTS